MEDLRQMRLTKCISTVELERRWKATREMMRERKIDYLVIQNQKSSWAERYAGSPILLHATSFQ